MLSKVDYKILKLISKNGKIDFFMWAVTLDYSVEYLNQLKKSNFVYENENNDILLTSKGKDELFKYQEYIKNKIEDFFSKILLPVLALIISLIALLK